MGKSWLGLHLAQAVATGTPFLGAFTVPKAVPVLYVQEEDAVETVINRYRLLERGHNVPKPAAENLTYAIQTGLRVDTPEGAKALLETAKLSKARLIILDVLNKLHVGSDADQNHATKVMRVFETVRRETGAAIIIIHHFSKGSPNRRGNQRMRGSSVFAGWSENSMYLSRSGAQTHVEVESKFAQVDDFCYEFEAVNEGLRLTIKPRVMGGDDGMSERMRRRLAFYRRESYKKRNHLGGR